MLVSRGQNRDQGAKEAVRFVTSPKLQISMGRGSLQSSLCGLVFSRPQKKCVVRADINSDFSATIYVTGSSFQICKYVNIYIAPLFNLLSLCRRETQKKIILLLRERCQCSPPPPPHPLHTMQYGDESPVKCNVIVPTPVENLRGLVTNGECPVTTVACLTPSTPCVLAVIHFCFSN